MDRTGAASGRLWRLAGCNRADFRLYRQGGGCQHAGCPAWYQRCKSWPGLFTPLTAASFLLFTLLYTPCVAAVATIRRELRSRTATIGVVLMQCVIAWIVATAVYQIGSLLV